jgi:prolyl-tRNA synthetase
MFAEWELIGPPVRITVGERGLNDGVIELLGRKQTEAARVPLVNSCAQTLALLETY